MSHVTKTSETFSLDSLVGEFVRRGWACKETATEPLLIWKLICCFTTILQPAF